MRAPLTSIAFALSALALAPSAIAGEDRGVVVESVPPRSTGEKAGLQVGDRLFSWTRRDEAGIVQAEGELTSPFGLRSMEIDQLSRGRVELHGARAGKEKTWLLHPGISLIQSRPALAKDPLSLYEDGTRKVKVGRVEKGTERWRLAAKRAEAAANPGIATWLLSRTGDAWRSKREWARADAAYSEAVRLARAEADPIFLVHVLRDWSRSKQAAQDWAGAEEKLRAALVSLDTNAPSARMERVVCLNWLSGVLEHSAPAEAGALLLSALQIVEALAPESLEAAEVLWRLAYSALLRSNYRRATELFERVVAIRRKHGAEDVGLEFALGQLAWLAVRSGDFEAAERHAQQSLEVASVIGPVTESHASALHTMAIVKSERGELAAADALAREAVQLRRQLGDKDPDPYAALLSVIAEKRGDLQGAELHSRQALRQAEKDQAPVATIVITLGNLGYDLLRLGRLDEAESLFQRGLQLASGKAPDGEASLLENLAILARTRGDLVAAERHLLESLAIQSRSSPVPVLLARSKIQLGQVALERGEHELAEERFRQALDMLSKLMPGSHLEARALNGLGRAQRAADKRGESAETLCSAVEALDQQRGRLGGAQESRSAFAAEYADYPRDCLAARVAMGQPEEALRVLERSRASVLLRMLAERHLAFSADLPAETTSERSRIDAEYDQTQAALGRLKPEKDAAEIDPLQARLQELRDQRADLAVRIRKSSPRLASLQYPEPLDLRGVREALDPGTLFLTYSVGEKETLLFALEAAGSDGPGFSFHAIPVARAELSSAIEALRGAISRTPMRSSSGPPPAARQLYRTLLGPVEAVIARHQRLLISPDGPLHVLPFAALWGGSPEAYLVERVPVHIVASATVYAELKKARRPTTPGDFRLVAFGDPKYPRLPKAAADELRNHELRAAVLRGDVFPPLPSTRTEVRGIADLFPGRATTFLGDQAKEEKAKAVGKEARYLHFACHAVLNERFPLDSALALSLPKDPKPGEDNGLLQAWEVFDSMRLDAELVTLSACQSGLGKEMGGEGLLGLTRAFQYAGARSVLASLWSVGDESTAELMKRFYRHLQAGSTKDEALRAAQREMIQAGAHPFHWAAFQLSGDWK